MNTINFQITGRCNLNCAFCCNIQTYQTEKKLWEIKDMIDCLPNTLGKVQITGGEPLLYENLIEVLEYLKDQGYQTSLSTNGILLPNHEKVLKYLDEIVLPIDAVSNKTLEGMGRERNQKINTLKNITMIQTKYPEVKIKLTTVLNQQNYQQIGNMLAFVQLLSFDEWEIHQFLPHGNGKKNIKEFLLEDWQFNQTITFLEASSIGEKIVPVSISDKIDTEWAITPDLELVKLKEDNAQHFGRVRDIDQRALRYLFPPKQYTKRINK